MTASPTMPVSTRPVSVFEIEMVTHACKHRNGPYVDGHTQSVFARWDSFVILSGLSTSKCCVGDGPAALQYP